MGTRRLNPKGTETTMLRLTRGHIGELVARKVVGPCIVTALAILLLAPTSMHAVPFGPQVVVAKYALILVIEIILHLAAGSSARGLFLAVASLLYLCVVSLANTLSDPDLELNAARLGVTIIALGALSLGRIDGIGPSVFQRSLDLSMGLIITVDVLILMRNRFMIGTLNSLYTQLDTYTATYYSTLSGKTVFTFGTANMAATFYLGLFLLAQWLHARSGARRLLIYQVALIVFTALCFSNAALVISGIMAAVMLSRFRKPPGRLMSAMVIGAVGLGIVIAAPLISRYGSVLSSSANGWMARYGPSSELFAYNNEFVAGHPFGLGLCTSISPMGFYFSDSGYAVSYLMGGVLFVVLFYVLVLSFVFQFGPSRSSWSMLCLIIITELSIVTFYYEKTILLLTVLHAARTSLAPDRLKASAGLRQRQEEAVGATSAVDRAGR